MECRDQAVRWNGKAERRRVPTLDFEFRATAECDVNLLNSDIEFHRAAMADDLSLGILHDTNYYDPLSSQTFAYEARGIHTM
jgi:hypothetical protein